MLDSCTVVMARKYGTVFPTNQAVFIGNNVTIKCRSHLPPQWFKDKKLLHFNENNTLMLINVLRQDSGWYYCRGTYPSYKTFVAKSSLLVGGKDNKFYF